ncbi:MAG TPA: carbonic anhydrase [Inquilinus sp.]
MCDQHCSAAADPSPLPISRRGILAGGAALLSAGVALSACAAAQPQSPSNAISADEALKRLLDGNARYVANAPQQKDFSAGRAARTQAQYPFASILSCADSRVSPELAFDQGPGDLFVVRVAGNFLNDDGLASLEYGALILNVPLIMVLGHSNCGAVDATIKVLKDGTKLPGHLPGLVNSIKPAVEAAKAKGGPDLLADAITENVRRNVRLLVTGDPVVAGLVKDDKVKVVGGVYDLATGRVNLV